MCIPFPAVGEGLGFEPHGRERLAEYGTDWAIIHACKSPCHQGAVGYIGNLDRTHPNYLVLESGSDLFLNMIDPPAVSDARIFLSALWPIG